MAIMAAGTLLTAGGPKSRPATRTATPSGAKVSEFQQTFRLGSESSQH